MNRQVSNRQVSNRQVSNRQVSNRQVSNGQVRDRRVSNRMAGVVLAAGESSRMGEPKALLDAGGECFVERAVRLLVGGGCAPVVAVVHEDPSPVAERARAAGARIVVNPDPATGQIGSLRVALDALPLDAAGCVVLPVDHPLVAPGTVAALIAAFLETGAPAAVPVHEGRRGHPVLFACAVFRELRHGELPEGARSVLRAYGNAVLHVPVNDPGVLADIDSPADYRRFFPSL